MNIDKLIICPKCGSELIMEASCCRCQSCSSSFSFDDGIPVLLVNPGEMDRLEAEYHSEIADIYEDKAQFETVRNIYYHENFLAGFNELPLDSLILEVGCGTGRDGIELLKKGYRLVETDIAPGIIKKAKQNSQSNGVLENTVYIIASGEKLPFKDSTFDSALIVATLHHFIDPLKTLIEIKRCLKPGGVLVMGMEPNSWFYYSIYPVIRFFKKFRKNTSSLASSAADETTRGFRRKAIEELLKKANLEIVRIKPVWFFCGFLHLGLEVLYRMLRLKRRIKAPIFIEKALIFFDEIISKIPLIKMLSWHWNITARRPR